jgi:predicted dinucleotide-binding enzyme
MNDETARATVAVLGAGQVGRTLARRLALAGHPVILGSREPRKVDTDDLPDGVRAAEHLDAARAADAVIVTVPGAAVAELARRVAPGIAGKPTVDATNNVGGPRLSGVPDLDAAGAVTFRAFNSVGWEQMNAPRFATVASDMFYAGPDVPDREVVAGLIAAVGFRPVWVGEGPQALAAVDSLLGLWFSLAVGRGWGRRLGFRLLTAADDDAGDP